MQFTALFMKLTSFFGVVDGHNALIYRLVVQSNFSFSLILID